ncbi:hypothetical protein HPB50_018547 [Hyalomma asiaticum]|uniref:Uncharacterized protein n=1 Tax=Hyalomma asiaticum TaxID=266040 RepID=A0ACB7TPV4_HYAAI|nr:hypothetical protein HPB50_018547 [Hyalomma asiaticum]
MEPANSEQRAAALERATLLFDRIKRGYPFEADLISQILPGFLGEFFPAQDILNKVIGEFLSNQQPYPQFLAAVLFKLVNEQHKTQFYNIIKGVASPDTPYAELLKQLPQPP